MKFDEILQRYIAEIKSLNEERKKTEEKCIELQEKLFYAIYIIEKIRREKCDFCANKSPIGSEECKVCVQVSKEHAFWIFDEDFLTFEGHKKVNEGVFNLLK